MPDYNQIKHLFPVCLYADEDFLAGLKRVLNEYYDILKRSGHDKSLLLSCHDIKEQIITIVRNVRKGKHSTAFIQLCNIFRDKKYGLTKEHIEKQIDGTFYRMRIMENRRDAVRKNQFHIPFTMREKVSTERFSFPGLPCLYLGRSIYVCWEEMNRPDFSQTMITALKPTRKLKLLDLSVPSPTKWKNVDQRIVPLILASQVVVRDKNAKYKSEYIIPQLIMEYVITSGEYDGVLYSSVYRDNQFLYPTDKMYNVALPAIQEGKDKDYSSKLINLFTTTEPTCEEYERMNRHLGDYKESTAGIVHNRNYENSIFHELERVLSKESLFPSQKIDAI